MTSVNPREFRVPYGLTTDQRLVAPADALKSLRYACPGCSETLVLKQGKEKRPHFAHKGSSACSGESATHLTAKMLIAQVVRDGRGPVVVTRCCDRAPSQEVPLGPGLVPVVEHRLASGRVLDVALLHADGSVAMAVEIHHTHAVTEEKARDLSLAGISWIELEAGDVATDPLRWLAGDHGSANSRCAACAADWQARLDVDRFTADQLRACLERWGMSDYDSDYYRVAPIQCLACGTTVPYFKQPIDAPVVPRRMAKEMLRHTSRYCPGCYVANDGETDLFFCEPPTLHSIAKYLAPCERRDDNEVRSVVMTDGVEFPVMTHRVMSHVVAVVVERKSCAEMSLALARESVTHRILAPRSTVCGIVRNNMKQLGRSCYDPNADVAVTGVDYIRRTDERWRESVTMWIVRGGKNIRSKDSWGKSLALFPNARGMGAPRADLSRERFDRACWERMYPRLAWRPAAWMVRDHAGARPMDSVKKRNDTFERTSEWIIANIDRHWSMR